MSIVVPLDDLERATQGRRLTYLVASDDRRQRVLQVWPQYRDGCFDVEVGDGTARTIARRSDVVLVFPPQIDDPDRFTLLVDGTAEMLPDGSCRVRPGSAVLHRRERS